MSKYISFIKLHLIFLNGGSTLLKYSLHRKMIESTFSRQGYLHIEKEEIILFSANLRLECLFSVLQLSNTSCCTLYLTEPSSYYFSVVTHASAQLSIRKTGMKQWVWVWPVGRSGRSIELSSTLVGRQAAVAVDGQVHVDSKTCISSHNSLRVANQLLILRFKNSATVISIFSDTL
jgi:hypothetical protein